ncbi:MAG: flagellar biosynthesis repressor FlbT [Dinoroseobacter sp.]|nr:flagellar biosynthesis repressor FlbT [Dinoroseobacter sp.]NQZ71449.1 flagellar biosynthesis repressor FlbT [Dinoroseobacter sp.]
MTGLVLKLAPGERVLVNGAVILNGERRARFSILTPNANVLRLRDALHPDEAKTPVKRVCYVAQLILSGDAPTDEGSKQLLLGIEQLSQVFRDPDSRALLADATRWVSAGNVYQALKSLRSLLPREERLMAASS